MELDDILKLDRLYCTGEQARAGWYLDQDAILEAMDKLGIELAVNIRFMTATRRAVSESGRGRSWGKGGKGYTYGTHRNTPKCHKITVDQERTAEETTNTLWHELAHAMQSERWAKETGKDIRLWHHADYKAVDGDWGNRYKGNAYELEAYEIAATNADFELVVFGT